MKKPSKLLAQRIDPQLMEHFDAYLLIGYSADGHRKVLTGNYGKDPSCRDGLQIMEMAARRWMEGPAPAGDEDFNPKG